MSAKQLGQISIHAPREGSDETTTAYLMGVDISIHAPREGSDLDFKLTPEEMDTFLSTLPVRGATAGGLVLFAGCRISIHAPREGSDRPI